MGGVCEAPNCFRSREKCPDLPFFSFPKNPISANKWIANIGVPELLKWPVNVLKNHVICALHFEEKYFVNKKKRSLVRNAIPTLFNIAPYKSEESHKKNEHNTRFSSERTTLKPGAIFSCDVRTVDKWHRQIETVTDQLLSLLPECSNQTPLVEQPLSDKHFVDVGTQYGKAESDLREFEDRLKELSGVQEDTCSEAPPKIQLLCRLCSRLLHRECVVPIYSREGEKIDLNIMLNSILITKVVQDDGLPQQVCNLCVKKLRFCYDVRNDFIASENKLRSLLGIQVVQESSASSRKRRRVVAAEETKGVSIKEVQPRRRSAARRAQVAVLATPDILREQPKQTDLSITGSEIKVTTENASVALGNDGLQESGHYVIREPPNNDILDSTKDTLQQPSTEAPQVPANDALQEPATDSLQEPANDTIEEPANDTLEQPANRTLEESVNDSMQESAEGASREPAESTLREPADAASGPLAVATWTEPSSDATRVPANDASRFIANETVWLPVNDVMEEVVEEHVEDTVEGYAEDAMEEHVEETIEEHVDDTIEEHVENIIKVDMQKHLTAADKDLENGTEKESVNGARKFLEKEDVKHPVKDAVTKSKENDTMKVGIKHSVTDEVKDTGNVFVRGIATHPVRELAKRTARDIQHRPARNALKDNIRGYIKESEKDKRSGSIYKDTGKEPRKNIVKEPRKGTGREPRKDTGREPRKDTGREPRKDTMKEPKKDAMKEPRKDAVKVISGSARLKNLPRKRKKTISNEGNENKGNIVKKMKLSKRGPQSEKTADESDFENDSNYEIHWYDEAYEDSVSEDIGSSDSFQIDKTLSPNNETTETYTSEDPEETKELLTGVEPKKTDNDEIVNTSSHHELDKSSLPDTSSRSSTESSPSVKESVSGNTSITPKLGPGSVRVRLMTERQKTLKIRNKAKIKLLKQAGKKNILHAKYSCLDCKRNFSSKLKLEQHFLIHQRFECKVCKIIFITADELSNHSKSHMARKQDEFTNSGPKNNFCEVCKQSFKTRQRLLIHSKTHTAHKSFTCSICCEAFTTRIKLKEHFKTHKAQKSFECLVCHESFKSDKALLQHGALHSESLVSLKCEICGAVFTDQKDHEKHKEQHPPTTRNSGVLSVPPTDRVSDVCSKDELKGASTMLNDNAELTVVPDNELTKSPKEDDGIKVKVPHLEKNLIITSSDKFVCDICDCKFSSQHFQEEHKKIHHLSPTAENNVVPESPVVEVIVEIPQKGGRGKMYFCDQCGEGYERKRSLALHRFSHTSSHRCSNCSQSFSSEESLARHLDICMEVRDE